MGVRIRCWKGAYLSSVLSERLFHTLRLERNIITYIYTRSGQCAIISGDLYNGDFMDLVEEFSMPLAERDGVTYSSSLLRDPGRLVAAVKRQGIIHIAFRGRGFGLMLVTSCLARLFELSQERKNCGQP